MRQRLDGSRRDRKAVIIAKCRCACQRYDGTIGSDDAAQCDDEVVSLARDDDPGER